MNFKKWFTTIFFASTALCLFIYAEKNFSQTHTLSVNADKKMDRMIFFGDDLTDSGNYPEPANVHLPNISNFNLYVPLTNPVPAQLYGKENTPDAAFLKKSVPPQGKINGKKRALYSINWSLYLTWSVHPDQQLTTWYSYQMHPSLPVTNLNYAWAGAIAGNTNKKSTECFDFTGNAYPGSCTAQTIIKHKINYLNKTNHEANYDKNLHYAFEEVQIPDLKKQIFFYLHDHTVSVKNNTTFFINIGENDLRNYFRLYSVNLPLPTRILTELIYSYIHGIISNVVNAVDQIEKAYNQTSYNYKIYILTVPDLTNNVEFYEQEFILFTKEKFRQNIKYSIDTYNKLLADAFKGDEHVIIADTAHFIDQVAYQKKFIDSVEKGISCIEDPSGNYTDPVLALNKNCIYFNNNENGAIASYFNWNYTSFVSDIHKWIARFIFSKMD